MRAYNLSLLFLGVSALSIIGIEATNEEARPLLVLVRF
jgi:hypothetical protein